MTSIVWRTERDIPALGLVAGDVVGVETGEPEPALVTRAIALDWRAFMAAEQDGALRRVSFTMTAAPQTGHRRRARKRHAGEPPNLTIET